MKTKYLKSILLLAITFGCVSTHAKTNTDAAVEQMRVNAENSESNYKQYKDNLEIVNKNVDQSEKAIKDLRNLKTQLINNTKNVDKNKLALKALEQDVTKLKQKEQGKMTAEDQQIADVQKILTQLQENKKKREANLVAYDQMVQQVQQEQKDWDLQVQQMATLQKELDTKELKAQEEKGTWTAKRKDYESEAKKWEGKAQSSRDTYNKYKKMKE